MHYFIIQTTKMMILWMRQKCVKNGIIKSKLYIYIDIEVINKIHRDRDRKSCLIWFWSTRNWWS